MSLIDRVGLQISRHTNCARAFPCRHCDNTRDDFNGAGCRVLATAALVGLVPDALTNSDDDTRAKEVAKDYALEPCMVIDVVTSWAEAALVEFEVPDE